MSEQFNQIVSISTVPDTVTAEYIDGLAKQHDSVEMLSRLAGILVDRNHNTKGMLNAVASNHDRVRRELDSLRKFLVSEIEEGSIDNESTIDALVSSYGVEVFETKSVSLTFEVTVDVKVARGTDLERYDFEVDGVTYQGDTVDVATQEAISIDIED